MRLLSEFKIEFWLISLDRVYSKGQFLLCLGHKVLSEMGDHVTHSRPTALIANE